MTLPRFAIVRIIVVTIVLVVMPDLAGAQNAGNGKPARDLRYSLIDLGDLSGGDYEAWASDVNERGDVVGWSEVEGNAVRPFIWSKNKGMQELPPLPGQNFDFTLATGVSKHGEVVGYGHYDDSLRYPLLTWDRHGTGPTIVAPALIDSIAGPPAINDAGEVAAGIQGLDGNVRTYLFRPGEAPRDIGTLNNEYEYARETRAAAINNKSQIAGSSNGRPIRWDPGRGMIDLLEGTSFYGGQAHGISDEGHVAGEALAASGDNTVQRAFLWTPEQGLRDLGALEPGSSYNSAQDVNDDGVVVGGGSGGAWVWSEDLGMLSLNSLLDESGLGWSLVDAVAINDRGQIVGHGNYFDNTTRGFILTPINPEPTTLMLMPVGAMLLARRSGRHRRRTAHAGHRA